MRNRPKGLQSEGLRGDLYAIRTDLPFHLRKTDVSRTGFPLSHDWLDSNDKMWPAGQGKDIMTKQMLSEIEDKYLVFDRVNGYNNLILFGAMLCLFTTQGRADRITRNNGLLIGSLEFENGTHKPNKSDTYVFIRITGSKTNQNGRVQLPFTLCHCDDPCFLCIVKEIYRRRRHQWEKEEPLFVLESGETLDYPTLLKCVKQSVEAIGYNPDNFGTHSLRSGGNAYNWEMGYSGAMREHLSNWASSSTRRLYEKKVNKNKKQLIAIAKRERDAKNVSNKILKLCESKKGKLHKTRQSKRLKKKLKKKRKHRKKR
eukprot:985618_1